VARAAADKALGEREVRWLAEAGILDLEGSQVRTRFTLQALDRVFIWCDEPNAGPEAAMPPGATTVDLIELLPPAVEGSFLDVGGGPGSMALVPARRGAERVISTDIGDAPSELARVNAKLNELPI